MARERKEIGDVDQNSQNLSGANALFTPREDVSKNQEKEQPVEEKEQKQFSFWMDKELFTKMDLYRVNTGISIKQQIIDAVIIHYKH